MPEKYDVLFVMGKNWRKYPPKNAKNSKNFKLTLSIESKMSALAAGEIYMSGIADKIVFLSGKSAGKNWPSEGEIMKKFMKKRYPLIPDEVIFIKENSVDTASDVYNGVMYAHRTNLKNNAVLTISYHLPRCLKLFQNYWLTTRIHGLISEKEIKTRSRHYTTFVKKYSESRRIKIEQIKEAILKIIFLLDKKGKILRFITQKIRNNER